MHTDNHRHTRANVAALVAILTLIALLIFPAPAAAQDLAPTWDQQKQRAQQEVDRWESRKAEEEANLAESPGDYYEDRVAGYEEKVAQAQAGVTAAEAAAKKEAELEAAGEPEETREIKESITYYETLAAEAQAAGDEATAKEAQAELEGSAFSPGLYGMLDEIENPEPEPDDSGSAAPSGSDSGSEGQAAPPAEESSRGGFSPFWLLAALALLGFGAYKLAPQGGGAIGERVREVFSPAMARTPASADTGRQGAAPYPGQPDLDDDDYDPLGDPDPDDPDDDELDLDEPDGGPGDGGPPSRLPPDEDPPDEDPKPEPAPTGGGPGEKEALLTYGHDLTEAARNGELDTLIGREDELDRVIDILHRKTKANPVLIGGAGVGKSALAVGLALRMAAGEAGRGLAGKRLVELNTGALVAGTSLRGMFEERLTNIIEEAQDGKTVLFIDELHTIMGAGNVLGGGSDASQILKPALARDLKMVGATTPEEYREHIEKDAALERRCNPVTVEAMSIEETVELLSRTRGSYGGGKVEVTDDAIRAAADLSDRYIAERNLPDKAVDLVDEAAGAALRRGRKEIGEPEIRQLVKQRTGIDPGAPGASEGERLRELEARLGGRVVGQEEAVSTVARAIAASRYMPDDSKPVSMLFAGPSGVGKTELAKAIATEQFGSEGAMVRIDMSEYQEQHRISNLTGAARGYIGSDKGGDLTEPVRRKPYSVVLLDEIEKAHPDVLTILLQVLDDGRLTDNSGRAVSFKNAVVIMTTNAGAQEIAAASEAGEPPPVERVKQSLLQAGVRPEWIGRVGNLCPFAPLSTDALQSISRLALRRAADRASQTDVTLTYSEEAADLIAALGYNPAYGARPLLSVVEKQVVEALTDMLMRGEIAAGDTACVEAESKQLVIHKAPPEDDHAKDPGSPQGGLPPDEEPPEEE